MADAERAVDRSASRRLITGYSLEMTGKDIDGLREAQATIPTGTRVNVTFLGTEDLDMRIRAAKAVLAAGFVPVPHLSARRIRSEGELEEQLGRLQEIGATEHLFIVGGDPATPEGPYADALGVIQSGLLEKFGAREVGITGYPEGHPDISTDRLWRSFEDKVAALRERDLDTFIVTQFGFDTAPVLGWISEVRDRGITALIRVGTPGPAGIKRLLAFARRFGIGANAMIVKKYGFSLANLLGTAGPDRFVSDLGRDLAVDPSTGEVALHFYAFGGIPATATWARNYRQRMTLSEDAG